jgi:hypothetical protein
MKQITVHMRGTYDITPHLSRDIFRSPTYLLDIVSKSNKLPSTNNVFENK